MKKNKKKDLHDVTFLIPVRLDSVIRLENIIAVVDFLHKYFNTSIHVLEAAPYQNSLLQTYLTDRIKYNYIEDFDPIFHRTKYINELVKNCETPFLAVWDTDVIIPPLQIIKAVNALRKKNAHFALPYQHYFLETSKIIREEFFKSGDISFLENNIGKMKKLYTPNPLGGAYFCNKNTYTKIGIENEAFYGWGREDSERVVRANGFGYEFIRIEGCLFHLTHARGINSKFHSSEQGEIKMSEVLRIYSMTKNELKNEVKNWDHIN